MPGRLRAEVYLKPARSRPGIEADLAENYRTRLEVYEKWLADSRFAGFCREIGESIPGKTKANLDFVQTR